nr:glycine cleavage system aminomethyltransferase GcvT [Plastoroseomonas hellenica]
MRAAGGTVADQETPVLRETPLADLHRELGGRMVPFAGYAMPVQYPAGIMAEHLHCRARAALFDVSHMGQAELMGVGGAAALEALTPADVLGLKPHRQRYALLTGDAGGILDDFMVTNLPTPEGTDRLFLIVNAANKDADFDRIAAHLPPGLRLQRREDRALLALQGPEAVAAIADHAPGVAALTFMGVAETTLFGVHAIISRSGYTGEDGVEISIPGERAEEVARALLKLDGVLPAGLGARDSLRLEAGLCLHGNDIDATTNPVEAGLVWSIGKRRRTEWNFAGAAVVRDALANGPKRLRVGLRPEGRQPARAHSVIQAADGVPLGEVTSGGFGPSVNAPVAMGYVISDYAADGTALEILVRGKALPCRVAAMPFQPHRYAR